MPIAITKTKTKAAALAVDPVVSETPKSVGELSLSELADLYGSLEDQCNAAMMNPVFARFDEAKKELAKRIAAEMEPEDSGTLSGEKWVLEIGAAAKNPRSIKEDGIPLIQGFLGIETFGKIAKVGLADLDKYLTPEQLALVVSTDNGFSAKRKIACSFKG